MKTTYRKGKSLPNNFTTDLPTREEFDYLSNEANRGDSEAADRLRKIIQNDPSIWGQVGNLSQHAEISLIGLISQGSAVLKESLRAKVDDLRNSLSGEIRDAVDGLLVDHVVVSWLEAQHTRMAMIQPQQFKRDADYWERRHERAHARYLAALKELVTIRELIGDAEGAERTSLAIHDGTA